MAVKNVDPIRERLTNADIMQITFDRWDAGFNRCNPGSVPVRSHKQAVQFLTVLAAATCANQVINARVNMAGGAWTAYFQIEDERLSEANSDYEPRGCLNDPVDWSV